MFRVYNSKVLDRIVWKWTSWTQAKVQQVCICLWYHLELCNRNKIEVKKKYLNLTIWSLMHDWIGIFVCMPKVRSTRLFMGMTKALITWTKNIFCLSFLLMSYWWFKFMRSFTHLSLLKQRLLDVFSFYCHVFLFRNERP